MSPEGPEPQIVFVMSVSRVAWTVLVPTHAWPPTPRRRALGLRGTAVGAFAGFPLAKHPVAGKTGSAQMEGKQSTSWFASFAPAVDPKYVVVVMITEGGTGGENAAPAARGIYESIFGVDTEAVFPKSGPPSEIPKISGVSR